MQDSQIIRTEYSDVMKKSYIDYAMSVIIARALPDVRDGLKPVHCPRPGGCKGRAKAGAAEDTVRYA